MRVFLVLALCFCARADTILVLPFFNRSNSPNVDWIGESIAEDVSEGLYSQGAIVLDREDRLEAYRRLSIRPNALLTHASIIKVGDLLDASQVVYGQFELTGQANSATTPSGALRITARVLNLKRTRQGPELAASGPLQELAALQDHIAWQAITFLMPKTAPSEQDFRKSRPAVRVDAIESYIRGLLAANPDQKQKLFTQSARLDERFSQPCFQLGRLYWEKKEFRAATGWLERVKQPDPHYMEARFLLGLCRYYTGDYTGAQQCFQEVVAVVPLNEVFNDLGAAQSRLNTPAAAESFRKALEGDSADPDYHFNLGYTLWKNGHFAEAADSFRATLDRAPTDAEAQVLLGRCLKKDGPRPEARTEGRERLKTTFEEAAYRQLKAEIESAK
jgi:tetratricopeptide (TPR) repeat protein